jgi:carbonic anhydrase/acetyltransferase-like protein (isoleucine patch superfamily)
MINVSPAGKKMPTYEINHKKPVIGKGTWIAPSAEIIGDVTIGENCYIGFGAIIRADLGPVTIGSQTLIEEGCVIHNGTRTVIGNQVIIGHMVMIHDAVIKDRCLIGMKSMICDNAVIHQNSIVAEQSLVQTGQVIAEGKVYAGSPARYLKDVQEHHKKRLKEGINIYMELIRQYHTSFKTICGR